MFIILIQGTISVSDTLGMDDLVCDAGIIATCYLFLSLGDATIERRRHDSTTFHLGSYIRFYITTTGRITTTHG